MSGANPAPCIFSGRAKTGRAKTVDFVTGSLKKISLGTIPGAFSVHETFLS